MTAWRNIACLGLLGASLFAGCTVTTSSGNGDGGLLTDTGGTSGTGGSTSVAGGSTGTGGTTGATSTIFQCTANYVAPATPQCGDSTDTTSCDSCLQTFNCSDAFKACISDTSCTGLINAMTQCMADALDQGVASYTDADGACQTSKGLKGTDLGATKASALWAEIRDSLDCSLPCCAVF